MRGVILYGPRDVRVEERDRPDHHRPDRRRHQAGRRLRLRLGPVALPRHRRRRPARPDGPRVRRHRRRSRLRRHERQARRLRRRLLLRLRQHLRDLPLRLPGPLRAPRTGRRWHASRVRARPAGRRHPGRHPRDAGARPRPRLLSASDVLGTGWFGAVAAQAGPGKTVAVVGDGAVGLLAVLAARQLGAERIIAMSPPRLPPAARPRLRRHRHRRASAATTASPASRTSPTGSAPTRSSRPSAPRSR